MDRIEVRLRRHVDDELVPAVFREMDPAFDLKCWKQEWEPLLSVSSEQDRKWNWSEKYINLQTVNYEYYAVECEEKTQGLTVIDTDFHRSRGGLNLVYVSFVATAPWNRHRLTNTPLFRRVGPLLLRHAVVRSEELGYKFRTGL